MTNCSGTMCHSPTCSSCFPKKGGVKTGPVDPSKPMELDDGTPVVLVSDTADGIVVKYGEGHTRKDPVRGQPEDSLWEKLPNWTYERGTGLFPGHTAETAFVLRNVAEDDGWVYHVPKFMGDTPEGLSANEYVPVGWTVQFREKGVAQWSSGTVFGFYEDIEYRYKKPAPQRVVHLPEDAAERNSMALFDGFMAYFPNAMAEVAKLSAAATAQHHPDQPMHWDRSKSLDHQNKIARHLIDAGEFDDKGQRHSTMVAWRAMAMLQEELERDLGLPPSPASKNRPW